VADTEQQRRAAVPLPLVHPRPQGRWLRRPPHAVGRHPGSYSVAGTARRSPRHRKPHGAGTTQLTSRPRLSSREKTVKISYSMHWRITGRRRWVRMSDPTSRLGSVGVTLSTGNTRSGLNA